MIRKRGEYKDLIRDFELAYECTTVIEHHITNSKTTDFNGETKDKYTEEEEFIYRDSKYNYSIIYKQGELIRTVKFCNYDLAKKFKKVYLNMLLRIR